MAALMQAVQPCGKCNMHLRADVEIQALPGDFAARIVGDVLLVPTSLAELAQRHHLVTAEEFAGYAAAFPSAVAAVLGWGPLAAVEAAARLGQQMAAAGMPPPKAPPKRHYGFG